MIELGLAMPVRRVEAHPKIKADSDRVVVQRGPVVYGLEGVDNAALLKPDGKALEVVLPADPKFGTEHRGDFLGGVTVVKGTGASGKGFLCVPFYAMANRARTVQIIWLPQAAKKETPTGWTGRLYRRYGPAG